MKKNIRLDLKILVLGDSGVGKTSFVKRWTKDDFDENLKATILPEFHFKTIDIKGKPFRVQLWDIGGQDSSPVMIKMYSKESHGCIIICDATNNRSLDDSIKWKDVIDKESQFLDEGDLPFILLQNKIDLISDKEERIKIEERTKKFSEENTFVNSFLTSAKDNYNINESINFLLENIVQRIEDFESKGNKVLTERSDTIQLRNYTVSMEQQKQSKCCC